VFEKHARQRDTYSKRIASYKRRESMATWTGAGLAGVTLLVAGGVGETVGGGSVPPVVTALILTLIVLSAGTLAIARVGFEWAATELERELHGQRSKERQKLPPERWNWPVIPELMWICYLYLVVLTGAGFLLAVWWSVLS
jgi:hypothetical protein